MANASQNMDLSEISGNHRSLFWICLVGVLFLLPSLRLGFLLDDYLYLSVIEGRIPERSPSGNLFAFVADDEARTSDLIERGILPWWSTEKLKVVLWRPLSDLTHRLDHGLFGRTAWLHHLHSLLWWLGMLFAAWILYRRVLPGAAAPLAMLLFALDESQLLPAAWVANRNALISTLPCLVGLGAHIRWREEGWRIGRVLSIGGFALGLLGGETALAVFAYWIAYELFASKGTVRSRLLVVGSALLLVAVYSLVYRLLGGGVGGSGVYINPMVNPLGYLSRLPVRILALLGGATTGFTADVWTFAPDLRSALLVAGAIGTVAVFLLIRSAWPSVDLSTHAALRWMLPGGLLALFPVAATFPSDRLLLVSSIGFSAGFAVILLHAWHSRRVRQRWPVVAIGGLLAGIHLLFIPAMRIPVLNVMIEQAQETERLARTFELDPPARHPPDAVLLAAPDYQVGIYLPILFRFLDRDVVSSWRCLSLARSEHRVIRVAPRTLVLEVVDGAMMKELFEKLYRDQTDPLQAGMTLDRGLFRVEILDAEVAGPTRVAFHFERDLDDPSLRFLIWKDNGLRSVKPPALGDTLYVESELGPVGYWEKQDPNRETTPTR